MSTVKWNYMWLNRPSVLTQGRRRWVKATEKGFELAVVGGGFDPGFQNKSRDVLGLLTARDDEEIIYMESRYTKESPREIRDSENYLKQLHFWIGDAHEFSIYKRRHVMCPEQEMIFRKRSLDFPLRAFT